MLSQHGLGWAIYIRHFNRHTLPVNVSKYAHRFFMHLLLWSYCPFLMMPRLNILNAINWPPKVNHILCTLLADKRQNKDLQDHFVTVDILQLSVIHRTGDEFNSLCPNDPKWYCRSGSILDQVTAWHLFAVKPLPESMMTYISEI